MIDMKLFQKELENLINIHSVDNEYNTPDYILAEYLINCLTTYSWTHRWIGDGLLHVTRETLLTPAQAAVLEAAEAELYGAKLDLAEAARHIGDGNAFRAAMRKELEAVRAQRDSLDKLWSDAVRELQRIDDERIQVVAERDALRKDAAEKDRVIYLTRWEDRTKQLDECIEAAEKMRIEREAERESDEFNEQFYKNQAISMKENARFEDMITDKRRIQLMKEAMEAQDIFDRYIKESLLDIQLLEGIAKAMFDRNEQHSVDTYNWKGYTARLWNKQFPDVTDYWVMLAQTALKEFYEKTNAY